MKRSHFGLCKKRSPETWDVLLTIAFFGLAVAFLMLVSYSPQELLIVAVLGAVILLGLLLVSLLNTFRGKNE